MCASECVCFHAATQAKKSNHCECSSNGARLNGWWGQAQERGAGKGGEPSMQTQTGRRMLKLKKLCNGCLHNTTQWCVCVCVRSECELLIFIFFPPIFVSGTTCCCCNFFFFLSYQRLLLAASVDNCICNGVYGFQEALLAKIYRKNYFLLLIVYFFDTFDPILMDHNNKLCKTY